MLISDAPRFVFIHVYKCAGSSISKALSPYVTNSQGDFTPCSEYPAHITAPELLKVMGPKLFCSYFSFAFVRNPWDWQVSLYSYMLKEKAHRQHELIKRLGSFEEYIKWRCNEEVRLQKDFIYSQDGMLLIDFLGKFERLAIDFASICEHLGISTFLPKLNVSNTVAYQSFYNERTWEMVEQAFAQDIEMLGYGRPNETFRYVGKAETERFF